MYNGVWVRFADVFSFVLIIPWNEIIISDQTISFSYDI